MKRSAYILALCLACGPPEDEGVHVENWPADTPPPPFAAGDPEAEACHIDLVFEPEDLPPELETPVFERAPELEAALNSIAPEACYGQAATSYAFTTDYDADGDADFIVRRPQSAQSCDTAEVGVLRSEAGALAEFEPWPGLRHAYLVGSLDDDEHPELVLIDQTCAWVLWYDFLRGFDHQDTTLLGCNESLATDEVTVTAWDLERDGDLDLLVGSESENSYYRNSFDQGGGFVEAIAEVGLTPAGAYAYDPNDPALDLGEVDPFDPLRAHSYYIYCDHEDPFDPLGPTNCQVDNDGQVSFNETYRCDPRGSCAWVDDRVDPACDVLTSPVYERYLCDTPITSAQFDTLTAIRAQSRAVTVEQALRIAHASGSPQTGDNTNPMSIAPFAIWPHVFEFKGQSEGIVGDTVASFSRARYLEGAPGWRQFAPYGGDPGISSGGHEQQSWGTIALENGSGWPILVTAHGKDGSLDAVSGGAPQALVEQIVERPLPCLAPPASERFGLSDVGVSVLGPDARFVTLGEIVTGDDGEPTSTGPIAELGVYKTIARSWVQVGEDPRERLYLLLGGFDGALRAYRVVEAGNILRLRLDPGRDRAPHGYGAVVFVELDDGRIRGPRTIGADGVQPHLGNHRHSWDFGVRENERVTVHVLWPWGAREVFREVAADGQAQLLVHGDGESNAELPDALARVLED